MANKPVKKAVAPVAPKRHTVKTKGVRVRAIQDVKLFYSDKHTQPINDVVRVENGDVIIIPGLTEEQKIAEGLQYPRVKAVSFEKTAKERKKWKEVHTNQKLASTGGAPRRKNEPSFTLIAHFINHAKKDPFVSTRSFKNVKRGEIYEALKSAVRLRDSNDSPLAHVSKYYFAGKRYTVDYGKVIEG